MGTIEWTRQFETGIAEIDDQHRQLVAIINQLFQVVQAGARPAGVLSVVNRLEAYTRYHFDFEEQLMEKAGYADLAGHKKTHEALAKQVTTFRDKIVLSRVAVSPALAVFLRSWLMKHIMELDMAYVSAVQQASPKEDEAKAEEAKTGEAKAGDEAAVLVSVSPDLDPVAG